MKFSVIRTEEVIEKAIKVLDRNIFTARLLEEYPVRIATKTNYSKEYSVLAQYQSPACTDGFEVFVSPEILSTYLSMTYKLYDRDSWREQLSEQGKETSRENFWLCQPGEKDLRDDYWQSTVVSEVVTIIAHELTHAFNEHSKIRYAARKMSQDYKAKLDVACELQANDGIGGYHYEDSYMQQLQGVTNKRLHPECIGKHTLKEFMDTIVLNPMEKAKAQWAKMADEMAKTTGAEEKIKQQVESAAVSDGEDDYKELPQKPTDAKLVERIQSEGLSNIKKLILESLSDDLRYDPLTDTVFYDKVKKRVVKRTYARPSRRNGTFTGAYSIIKKGYKTERVLVPDKTNKLTVLAVDASGSMTCQQQYVAIILDKLLKQVEEIAKQENIEVHYENLYGCFHRCNCSELIPVKSDRWDRAMREYRAGGGNCFTNVLNKVGREMVHGHDYDTIRIINLSDGLDHLMEHALTDTDMREAIKADKVKWIDALISGSVCDANWARDCKQEDTLRIRTQIMLNILNR